MLKVERLTKTYPAAGGPLTVLREVSFELPAGASLAIVGPSGKPVVTWKTSSSERVDVKKVREVLPADLVAQCVVVSESRRFLVK